MIKILKPAIFFLIQILVLQGVCGQVPDNMTDFLSEKFLRYIKSVPREEIYIHMDRDEYISGEDLWLNMYLIDRQSLKLSFDSKIAYFELLNQENRPVVQMRVLLNEGFGPGKIVLPDTLSTGIYTIRAYTSWMKNFLPFNCFIKDIYIYNAFSNRSLQDRVNSGKISKEGINTEKYPGTTNSGLTLKAENLKPNVLEITVITDEKFRSENNNQFYLFIQTHGMINLVSSERTTDYITKISIPKKQLTAGINQITVFNSKGQPVDERFIFTPDHNNPVITIHAVDSSGLRNKVSLDLEFGNGLTPELNLTNFSISVASEANRHSIFDLDDYMIFGTEFGFLPGMTFRDKKVNEIPPEIMDSLLQTVKSNWINWNTILTDEQPVFKYRIEKEDHFISGKLLTGDHKAAESDKFVLLSSPGKTAVFQYAKTDKEGNFSFIIHIDEKVNDLIIQPDEVTKGQSVNIESSFSDKYFESEKSVDSTIREIPEYISTWSVNHQVRKIYGLISDKGPLPPLISTPKPKRFYGKPDAELIMKDYITLPVMQEVFFELLTGVFLKNKNSGYEISVADPDNNKTYEIPPGLFIDGVKIKDPSIIAGLDPEVVEEIDVVREKYFVGDYLFYGIVNVITKAGDLSNVTLPDYVIRQPYRVIDPVYSFISPDYSSIKMKRSRIPDFRNTLYWNPSVKPDKDGKIWIEFWTSDFASDYEINIQGITSEGKTFSIKKIIRVK